MTDIKTVTTQEELDEALAAGIIDLLIDRPDGATPLDIENKKGAPAGQLQRGPAGQRQSDPVGQLQRGPVGQRPRGPVGQLQSEPEKVHGRMEKIGRRDHHRNRARYRHDSHRPLKSRRMGRICGRKRG